MACTGASPSTTTLFYEQPSLYYQILHLKHEIYVQNLHSVLGSRSLFNHSSQRINSLLVSLIHMRALIFSIEVRCLHFPET